MRHRILRRLLICCLLLPASACADKGSGEENGGNGGNGGSGQMPGNWDNWQDFYNYFFGNRG